MSDPVRTALEEIAGWAQAILTALNIGDLRSESPLHKKLRSVMIAYREIRDASATATAPDVSTVGDTLVDSPSRRITVREHLIECADYLDGKTTLGWDTAKGIAERRRYALSIRAALLDGSDVRTDDPRFDATDVAHPAWWRGHDHTTRVFCDLVTKILDGRDDGSGANHEPWATVRRRLLALVNALNAVGLAWLDVLQRPPRLRCETCGFPWYTETWPRTKHYATCPVLTKEEQT